MNETAVIFQYLLDNLPEMSISLKCGKHDIELIKGRSALKVTKNVSEANFEVADPECPQKITAFLLEDEPASVEMNFDMWYRLVSEEKLAEIGYKANKIILSYDLPPRGYAEPRTSRTQRVERDQKLHVLWVELMNSSYHNKNLYNADNSIWLDDSYNAWVELIIELTENEILVFNRP